jgi:5S rRNA maturation endonuclease (ribonuclease M5)
MATLSREQILKMSNAAAEDIGRLLDHFQVDFIEHPNRFAFACPIHGGDNTEACCIFSDGNTIKGNWQCWTKHCEEEYSNNLLGFIRGTMESKYGRKVNLNEAYQFTLDFIGGETELEGVKAKHFNPLEEFQRVQEIPESSITRDQVRSKLKIPSEYFIKRGFKPETLDDFDVGHSFETGKPMSGRSVAPIYDQNFMFIGCAGRAENDRMQPKWLYSKGFKKCVLYGIHRAYNRILETGSVILVEGQGDVWRMHESGYTQTVGIFGCSLTDDQLILLEKCGVMNVVVLTDSDEAGEKAYEQIVKKGGRRFNYYRPTISTKDVGDLSIEQIKEELGPQLLGVTQ